MVYTVIRCLEACHSCMSMLLTDELLIFMMSGLQK